MSPTRAVSYGVGHDVRLRSLRHLPDPGRYLRGDVAMTSVTGAPRIRVQLLGPLGVATSDGEDVRALRAQPKRLGLLAYLLLAEPAGFQRRESLLALLWPELDTEAARRALRQSLHFLRVHLGSHAILGMGSEAIAVAPDAFWCDALAFREAIAAGRLADAVGCYRGELLAGFHLREAAPAFEVWLSDERRRMRQQALDALRQLTRMEEEAGRYERALSWARAWLGSAPHDDSPARAVMRLEHASDDLRAALDTYDTFTMRKRQLLGEEPERETRALAETIRREVAEHAPVPAPRVVPRPLPEVNDPPSPPVSPGVPRHVQVPLGPWGFVAALALVALGASLAFAFAVVALARR
jgi:serine/threonine-protein kinase